MSNDKIISKMMRSKICQDKSNIRLLKSYNLPFMYKSVQWSHIKDNSYNLKLTNYRCPLHPQNTFMFLLETRNVTFYVKYKVIFIFYVYKITTMELNS